MKKSKKLLIGIIWVLSIVATTATPVYAVDADPSNVHGGGMTVKHKEFIKQTLVEEWNILNGDVNQIYYIKDSKKQTGWLRWFNTWYYFDTADGHMLREQWLYDGGNWYYLNERGETYSDIYIARLGGQFNETGIFTATSSSVGNLKISKDTTFVNKSLYDLGSIPISIEKFNSKVASGDIKASKGYGSTAGSAICYGLNWYLTATSNNVELQKSLVEGWNVLNDGSIYYVENGNKKTGWEGKGSWCKYFDETGKLLTNQWLQQGSNWYYLDCKGNMLCGNKTIGNVYYTSLGGYFDENGVFTKTSDTTGTRIMNELTYVDKSRNDGGSQSISMADFNKKVASGEIKVYVSYGSTGGSGKMGNSLSWYLV